jgi:hypothetical protein
MEEEINITTNISKTCGYLSFALSSLALIITGIYLTLLSILPPAKQLFQYTFYISLVPLILSVIGIIFHFKQCKLTITKISTAGLIISIITLLINIYMGFKLLLAI